MTWTQGSTGRLPGRDTLVVTKLDRLARSLRDAKDIVDELTRREVKLSIGGSVHDPTDPVGRLLFNVLAMVAEFEADLIRARTREGMAVAKAKGRLRGKQPKLSTAQEAHLVSVHLAGTHTTVELAELFGVARSTVYRAILGRVTDAGGEVVLGKSPIPTMGWMARFRDSEGNTIGLLQEDTSVPMPEGGMG